MELKRENKISELRFNVIIYKNKSDDSLNENIWNINFDMNLLLYACKVNSFIKIETIVNLYLLSNLMNSLINIAIIRKDIFEYCFFVMSYIIKLNFKSIYLIPFLICKLNI